MALIGDASGDLSRFPRQKLRPQYKENACLHAELFVAAGGVLSLHTQSSLFLTQAARRRDQTGHVLGGSQALGGMWGVGIILLYQFNIYIFEHLFCARY